MIAGVPVAPVPAILELAFTAAIGFLFLLLVVAAASLLYTFLTTDDFEPPAEGPREGDEDDEWKYY